MFDRPEVQDVCPSFVIGIQKGAIAQQTSEIPDALLVGTSEHPDDRDDFRQTFQTEHPPDQRAVPIRNLHLEPLRAAHGFRTGITCLASWSLPLMYLIWWVGGKIKGKTNV